MNFTQHWMEFMRPYLETIPSVRVKTKIFEGQDHELGGRQGSISFIHTDGSISVEFTSVTGNGTMYSDTRYVRALQLELWIDNRWVDIWDYYKSLVGDDWEFYKKWRESNI